MDTPYGPPAAALSGLTRGIREYSLFQAVLLVVDRLREAHPYLSQDDLYTSWSSRPTRVWAFRAVTLIVWSFFMNTDNCVRVCAST